ncbi:MAG: TRAP transporter substrate-binding protein, partial [Pseudomonadota bacterium]
MKLSPLKPTTANLKRRQLLSGLAIAPALAAPAVHAQAVRTLTLVTTWPRGLPGLSYTPERFADRINTMSGGTLKIDYFAAGEKMGAFDSFDAVSQGVEADMYHAAEYYWQGRDRAYNFFTTVPFGLTAQEFSTWIERGGGQALWDRLAANYNIKSFMCGNTGTQMGGWYAQPIRSLEDMRGIRIRIPGLAADIFRALGAEPVSLPGGQIPKALFAGEIDAVEWVGPYNDLEFGVHKVLRHYMYPGFHEPGTCASLGINLRTWNSLDPAQQAAIQAACAAENRTMLAEYSARSGAALTQMQVEYGTQVHRFADDVYNQVAEIVSDIMSGLSSESPETAEVVQSFTAFRAQMAPFARQMTGETVTRRAAFLRDRAQANQVFD